MDTNKLYIEPRIRLLFLCIGVVGTIATENSNILLLFYSTLILPLFIFGRQFKKHLNLMVFGMVPIFLSFVLIYVVILKGSIGSWDFILLKMLKLILLTSTTQLVLLIPSDVLIPTFKKWGLGGEALVTVLGAFTVWADVSYRTNRILTSRFARGFIEERTFINKARQLPHVLIPLIIGIIRTAVERADSWEQRDILNLLENYKISEPDYPLIINGLIVVIGSSWFLLTLYYKTIL